jgi:pimeloyl-ACP methyl ester carboxylesterase
MHRTIVRALVSAALLAVATAATAVEQPFDFRLEARTTEDRYDVHRELVPKDVSARIYCSDWGIEHPCVTEKYKCVDIYLGPQEYFPSPRERFNRRYPDTIYTVDNNGGEVIMPEFPNGASYETHGCKVGFHENEDGHGYRFTALLHMGSSDAVSNSTYKVTFHIAVDYVDAVPNNASPVTMEESGSATVASDELLALPAPHAKNVYAFATPPEAIASAYPDCPERIWDFGGVCVSKRRASPITYRVLENSNPDEVTLGMFDVPATSTACELVAGSVTGPQLCASMTDIGLAIPPLVSLQVIGEGTNKGGLPVGRYRESVCYAPSVMSFARGGLRSLGWTTLDGKGAQRTLEPGVDAATGQRCDDGLALGDNVVIASATDANGTAVAAEHVSVSRGPVGLLHGYLVSDESDWDDTAARLEAEGFQTHRIDLKSALKLDAKVRFPFTVHTDLMNYDRVVKEPLKITPPIGVYFPGVYRGDPNAYYECSFLPKIMSALAEFFKPIFPKKDVTLWDDVARKWEWCTDASGPCYGVQIRGKLVFKVPAFKLALRVSANPSLEFKHGTFVKATEGRFAWPIAINDHELARVGAYVRTTFLTGSSGEFIFAPFVDLTSPLFGLRLANGDLFQYNHQVSSWIDTVLEESGYKRMSLVGHDMGGVLARWYINHTPTPRKIEKVIFTGTPHRGSETIFLGYKALKMLSKWLCGMTGPLKPILGGIVDGIIDMLLGEGGKQLFPHSTYLQALNGNPTRQAWDYPDPDDFLAKNVQVFNYLGHNYVAGQIWLSPSFGHWHLPLSFKDPFYDMPNVDEFLIPWFAEGDFMVSMETARLINPNVTERVFDHWAAWHANLNNDYGRNVDQMIEDLESPTPTYPEPAGTAGKLRAAAYALGTSTSTSGVAQTQAEQSGAAHLAMKDAFLAPGESLVLEVPGDASLTKGLFLASSSAPIVLEVAEPQGRTHRGAVAAETGLSYVEISAPESGTYVATVTLADGATEAAPVLVTASFKTPVYLGVRTAGLTRTQSGADRVPGEDVLVGAVFRSEAGPLDSGSVSCVVTDPAGSQLEVSLVDDGAHHDGDAKDGLYSGVYPAERTLVPGTYDVRCHALGTLAGDVVQRTAALPFVVRSPVQFGFVAGSLRVTPAAREGSPATIEALVYNSSSVATGFLTVEAAERVAVADRLVGCAVVGRVGPASVAPVSIPWTPGDAECRDVVLAFGGDSAGTQVSNDPASRPPEQDARLSLRVCPAKRQVSLVADAGGPYRYQAGGRRVVFDGTGSRNTTPSTRYEWTVTSHGATVASGVGPITILQLPKADDVVATLRLVDPERGTAAASVPVTFVGALDRDENFLDHTPPVALIDAPDEAIVGQEVVIRSASHDDFGAPAIHAFRLGGLGASTVDAVGRVVTTRFDHPGDYEIVLTVQDNAGYWSTATKTVRVRRPTPAISRVVVQPTLEVGREATAYVQVANASAGEDVQLTLSGDAAGIVTLSGAGQGQTNACGVAQVRFTPTTLDRVDVRVEVLGSECDPATGACSPAVAVTNPGGAAPRVVDTTPPAFLINSPASGESSFDACRPLRLRFAVADDGAGVDWRSLRVYLDGARIADATSCVDGQCAIDVDPAGLAPGSHVLALAASDGAGNAATAQRAFRVEVSPASLVCRIRSAVCADIAPDGTDTALVAHVSAAAAQERARQLTAAGNELAAFIFFASAERGKHIPTTCADLLVQEADAIIRTRWGLDPRQLQ